MYENLGTYDFCTEGKKSTAKVFYVATLTVIRECISSFLRRYMIYVKMTS